MDLNVTQEKLEYLLRTELPKWNTLLSFEIDGSIIKREGEEILQEYFLNIEIENFSNVEAFPEDLCGETIKISTFIYDFNKKYKIGYRGKINQNVDVWENYYPKIISSHYIYAEKFTLYITTGGFNG